MCPVLVLLLAALSSECTATSPGLEFTIAFPENIAFYYPYNGNNKVRVTALYPSTNVKVIRDGSELQTLSLTYAGDTQEYAAGAGLELSRNNISRKSLQLSSDNLITVHVISLKSTSMQTFVVTPNDKLGTVYHIPPVPRIEGTSYPPDLITNYVVERSPFQVVIINTDQENAITVEGEVTKDFVLEPYQVAQVKLTEYEALQAVKASLPVAVLFGHTCAISYNCTCAQLYATLLPATDDTMNFYVPPVLAQDAESETFILVSESGSTKVKPFDPSSPLVKTTGTAVIYRPGLLLPLIPDLDFAACYVINSILNAESFAVIIVHKDATDGVHVGSLPVESDDWTDLGGTEYTSTQVLLSTPTSVIWHAYSTMAVYFMGNVERGVVGNPASAISKIPDFRGCAVSPEVVKIGEVADGWRESLQYCRESGMDLVSLPFPQLQKQVYERITKTKNDTLLEVWIGMRRSSQTGEWYWLSNDLVNETNWSDGEPGTVHDGQCAMMSVDEFGWSDESCCKLAHPVCYKGPILLQL